MFDYEFYYQGSEVKANSLLEVIEQLEENEYSPEEIIEALKGSEY